MAVTSPLNRTDTYGTGAVSVFQFPYYFLQNADLQVWLTDYTTVAAGEPTLLVYGTDYTVAGAGNVLGGSITLLGAPTSLVLPVPPTSTQKISIIRSPALTQELILPGSGPLNTASIVTEFDNLEMQIQALAAKYGDNPFPSASLAAQIAAIQLAQTGVTATFMGYIAGTTLTVTTMLTGALVPGQTLAATSLVANTNIQSLGTSTGGVGTVVVNNSQTLGSSGAPVAFTASGTGFVTSAGVLGALASTAVGQGDALIGVLQPFTGAVARTQHSKNIDALNPCDFGVVGDGVTDNYLALTAFFVNMAAGVLGQCKSVKFPYGRYYISAPVIIPPFSGATMNLDQRSCDGQDWDIDFGRGSFLLGGPIGFIFTQAVVTAGAFVIGQGYTILSAGTTSFTAIGAANNNVGTTFNATGVGTGTGTAAGGGTYPATRNGLVVRNGMFAPFGTAAIISVFALTGSAYWMIGFEKLSANKLNGSIGSLVTYYNDSTVSQAGIVTLRDIQGFNIGNIISFSASTASIAASTGMVDDLVLDKVYHIQNAAGNSVIATTSAFQLSFARISKVVNTGPGVLIAMGSNYIVNSEISCCYSEPTTTALAQITANLVSCTLSNLVAYVPNSATLHPYWYNGDARQCRFDNVHVNSGDFSGGHPYSSSSWTILYINDHRGNVLNGYTSVELKNALSLTNVNKFGTALGVTDEICLLDNFNPNMAGISTATSTTLMTSPTWLQSFISPMTSGVLDVQIHGYGSNAASKTLQHNLVFAGSGISVPVGGALTVGAGSYISRARVIMTPLNAGASFTGHTATNVLTLDSNAVGTFALGQALIGPSNVIISIISTLATGTLGQSGSTYNLSTTPGTIASEAMSSSAQWQLQCMAGESINQAGTLTLGSSNLLQIQGTWWTVNATDVVSVQAVTSAMGGGSIWPVATTVSRLGRGVALQVNP